MIEYKTLFDSNMAKYSAITVLLCICLLPFCCFITGEEAQDRGSSSTPSEGSFRSSSVEWSKLTSLSQTLGAQNSADSLPVPTSSTGNSSGTTHSYSKSSSSSSSAEKAATRTRRPKVPMRLTTENPRTTSAHKTEIEQVHEKWQKFEGSVKKMIESRMKKALPKVLRIGLEAKISANCSKSIMSLVMGIRSMKSWAFRMLDASAKLPSGVLDGTLSDFGDYDECLEIVKYQNDVKKDKMQFRGQYCTLEGRPTLPPMPHRVTFNTVVLNFSNFTEPDSVLADFASNSNMFYLMHLRLGLCLPSTCSVADVQEIARLALKDVPLQVNVTHCEIKEEFEMNYLQMGIASVIGFMILLMVIGTYIDSRGKDCKETVAKTRGTFVESLIAFSLKKNLKKIFRTEPSKENFGVLNGTRVLSMVWVVLVHTYGFSHRQTFARMQNAQGALNEVTFGTIINAWVIVDTFFVLGAFLVGYSNLKALERKKGKLNLTRYYLHRIWRLIPPVAGVLMIMFLLPLAGSGPMWKDVVGHEVENCEKYWWQVLILPINTWTHFETMCLLHTWYIASDLHFYFLAPLILYPLYKWPALGFLLMVFFTLVCMGITATLTIINDFYPTLLYFTPDESFTKWICDLVYFRPYPHMGAYCVGLTLAFIILKHRTVKIKPFFQILGWSAAIACNMAVLYGAFEWNRGNLPNKFVDVSYAMLHRTGWALGIGWLLFMCITERAGLINKFLSWKLFTPLSRLSYSAYILHFPVLWVRNGLRRERLLFHHYDIFYDFLATLCLTLTLSVTFYSLFEAPFLNLEEVWFPKKSRSKKTDPKENGPEGKRQMNKLENGYRNGYRVENGHSNGHRVENGNSNGHPPADKVYSVHL